MNYCYFSIFSSPYSPDLSPIEEAFGTAKSWLKRHRDVAQQSPKYCIALALNQVKKQDVSKIYIYIYRINYDWIA